MLDAPFHRGILTYVKPHVRSSSCSPLSALRSPLSALRLSSCAIALLAVLGLSGLHSLSAQTIAFDAGKPQALGGGFVFSAGTYFFPSPANGVSYTLEKIQILTFRTGEIGWSE